MQARASGVLLPVFSLPGPYGVGTFGTPAREFVDFLAAGGQKFWQILPLVPPGGGNSPYMSPSSFAGNPLFLDLDELAEEGLLTAEELDSARRDTPDRVDYPWLLEPGSPCCGRPGRGAGPAMPGSWRSSWRRSGAGCPTTPCSWPCGTDSTESRWPTGPTSSGCGSSPPWKRPGRS